MSEPHHPDDELRRIWIQGVENSNMEQLHMNVKLLREKQRSLHDFLHIASSNTYLLALSFVPIFVLLALKLHHISTMQIGNLLIAVVLLIGAAITWQFDRRADARLNELNLGILDYQSRFLLTIEESIKFSKSIKFWFVPALFTGISLAAFPVLNQYFPISFCAIVLFGVLVCFEFSVWRFCDRKRVRELQQRKAEVESLVKDMASGS
jgi:hypothetical protein